MGTFELANVRKYQHLSAPLDSLKSVRLKIILTGNLLPKKRVKQTEYQSNYNEHCFIIISDLDNAMLDVLRELTIMNLKAKYRKFQLPQLLL